MMEITRHDAEFEELVECCMKSSAFDVSLYTKYDVKRGLRDSNGNGVVTGLTEISDVVGSEMVDGKKVPIDGNLYYQGYNVQKLIDGSRDSFYGFEEVTYLLLFGALPTRKELKSFIGILADLSELSGNFIRDVIMKAPSANLMNSMMKSILNLYSYDDNPDDISVSNVLRQSLQMIAKMPLIAAYSYQAYGHFKLDQNMIIRNPRKDFSTAQN
ncbi:MAG: citrate synthase, partial [Lachnospira sp.]|nr:citrate synthase [Lachnospira sp.]